MGSEAVGDPSLQLLAGDFNAKIASFLLTAIDVHAPAWLAHSVVLDSFGPKRPQSKAKWSSAPPLLFWLLLALCRWIAGGLRSGQKGTIFGHVRFGRVACNRFGPGGICMVLAIGIELANSTCSSKEIISLPAMSVTCISAPVSRAVVFTLKRGSSQLARTLSTALQIDAM